ncbi:ribosomal protein S18-alanine N-acetyltransferase [Glycomyces albidus]|uniref:Ribosomal-protein-alanine N-acetyltransferase n=1 Tax=Glycomyces albidus TaxID=2656774 RepID=A0A6L5GBX7_9ACTN|nr:ribosomal protein S18-alanine N-acetyltransferase [Glycomyces albidus]MQM27110.1 ribosomal-protein-alanine N-acetyltransferase [Glycomyces albidus]
MNGDFRIGRVRWWHLSAMARMESAIFGPEAWSEGLLWSELAAGHDYRALFDVAVPGHAVADRAEFGGADPGSALSDRAAGAPASADRTPGADDSAGSGAADRASGGRDADGRIAGYAGTAFTDTEAWINNIAVDEAYRRRGVASMLMDDLLARARAHGAKSVFLEVAVDNVPAQRLYDRYGFYGIGVRKNYYQHTGTDAAVMRMDL